MNYQESYEYVVNTPLFASRKNGLDNIRELLRRLGDPQNRVRAVHVAGTNGKGSACAFIDSILRAAGYRTGLYTSPFLERFTERFRIDGQEITREDFARLATRVRTAAEAMQDDGLTHPTFFELITAVCFLYFEDSAVDIAVIETGLGGRLDATNVIHPALSVIMSIGLDHIKVLGDTAAAIAREKAGIMKPGTPVVVYPQPDAEAWAELLAAARNVRAPLYSVADCQIVVRESGLDGQAFSLDCHGLHFPELRIGLLGRHQVLNAATAVLAAVVLAQSGEWAIGPEHIRAGLEAARWAGRMEVLCRDPFVILDGAHNPQGAQQLRRTFEDLFPAGRAVLVCGILRTKQADEMIREFSAIAAEVIITRPDSAKAFPCDELRGYFERDHVSVSVQPEAMEAFEMGLTRARQTDTPLMIAGSLYLAGAARTWFRGR